MPTLTKPKKKPVTAVKSARLSRPRLPAFMQTDTATGLAIAKARSLPKSTAKKRPGLAVSPVTGLYFKPLQPGQKPVSRAVLKAALAESL